MKKKDDVPRDIYGNDLRPIIHARVGARLKQKFHRTNRYMRRQARQGSHGSAHQ